MYANILGEYHQAKQIKLPDIVPASAGGLNKTSETPILTRLHASESNTN